PTQPDVVSLLEEFEELALKGGDRQIARSRQGRSFRLGCGGQGRVRAGLLGGGRRVIGNRRCSEEEDPQNERPQKFDTSPHDYSFPLRGSPHPEESHPGCCLVHWKFVCPAAETSHSADPRSLRSRST